VEGERQKKRRRKRGPPPLFFKYHMLLFFCLRSELSTVFVSKGQDTVDTALLVKVYFRFRVFSLKFKINFLPYSGKYVNFLAEYPENELLLLYRKIFSILIQES
jgi:hypothetical protein